LYSIASKVIQVLIDTKKWRAIGHMIRRGSLNLVKMMAVHSPSRPRVLGRLMRYIVKSVMRNTKPDVLALRPSGVVRCALTSCSRKDGVRFAKVAHILGDYRIQLLFR
jgi:hypothetical protein